VISVVGVLSFSTANKKSRDSRRSSDLEKIRIGLEMIKQVGNTYPAALTTLVPNYMQQIPSNPKGNAYVYTPVGNYRYTLSVEMEDTGSTNMVGMIYQVTNP
jgi:hypothetical protein